MATEMKADPISKSTGHDVVFPTRALYTFLVCGFVLLCYWMVGQGFTKTDNVLSLD